jgi:hypothetical protein
MNDKLMKVTTQDKLDCVLACAAVYDLLLKVNKLDS